MSRSERAGAPSSPWMEVLTGARGLHARGSELARLACAGKFARRPSLLPAALRALWGAVQARRKQA